MEKKDLYLSDAEIDNIQYGFRKHRGLREVANCSAQYAAKKVIEHLDGVNLAQNHPNCFMMALEDWEALKKLIET